MTFPRDSWLVSLSFRLYSFLLLAYPPSFRRTYRTEMARVFRDSCRSAYEERGVRALIDLWPHALWDLLCSLIREWMVAISDGAARHLIRQRLALLWFAMGAALGLGLITQSRAGVFLMMVTVLVGITAAARLRSRGIWAALIGFGLIPVVIFGHAIANSPPPCPPDPLWPGKLCVDPLMGERIGLPIFGVIALAGLCLAGGRRLELLGGLLAGLTCLASGVYAAFWPLYTSTTCTAASHCVTISASFWQQGAYANVMLAVFMGLLGGSILAGSAYLHSRHEDPIGLTLLWIVSLLLTGATIIGVFGIGVFTLLPALFTWIATWAGSAAAIRSRGGQGNVMMSTDR